MKKLSVISKTGVVTLWVLCLLFQHAQVQSQDPTSGIWEGTFMNDFKTVLILELNDEGAYTGKILMYNGDIQIQNDEITRVSLNDHTLSFYIADKVTTFSGSFNEAFSELSGTFIFPDKSEHSLAVRKVEIDS